MQRSLQGRIRPDKGGCAPRHPIEGWAARPGLTTGRGARTKGGTSEQRAAPDPAEAKRPPWGEARFGNGPGDRFRAERAEPPGGRCLGSSAGRGVLGAIHPYPRIRHGPICRDSEQHGRPRPARIGGTRRSPLNGVGGPARSYDRAGGKDEGRGFKREGSARPGGCKAPAMGRGGRCPAFCRAGRFGGDTALCRGLYPRIRARPLTYSLTPGF